MMNTLSKTLSALARFLLPLLALVPSLHAADVSDLTFGNTQQTVYGVMSCDVNASGELVIPATHDGQAVIGIDENAFQDCAYLTKVVVPEGVRLIGYDAFMFSNGLQAGDDPDQYNFNSALKSVELPSTLEYINQRVFSGCDNLESVTFPNGNDSLQYIHYRAFEYCRSLKRITIPDPGRQIEVLGLIFYGCINLQEVEFPDNPNNPLLFKDGGHFKDCHSLLGITIPSTAQFGQLFGVNVFENCRSLTSERINLPEGLTSLGLGSFKGCLSLDAIDFLPASYVRINGELFRGCGFTDLNVHEGITRIDYEAFRDCLFMTTVRLPQSLDHLASNAFADCPNLQSATFAGDAPSTLGTGIFDGAADGFTIYYYTGASGFTTPTWQGYNTVELDGISHTVTFEHGAYASRTGGGALSQTITEGSTATAPEITPDAGYAFLGWMGDFSNVLNDRTITANVVSLNSLNNEGYFATDQLADQIAEGRPGSSVVTVDPANNQATLQLKIQRSEDLLNWTETPGEVVETTLPVSGDKAFFRFSFAD